MCDKGYDSSVIRKFINNMECNAIIPYNMRNSKESKTLSKEEKLIYKKWIKVENYFSWIKQYPKLDKLYEKSIKSYLGLCTLASINMIVNKLVNSLV